MLPDNETASTPEAIEAGTWRLNPPFLRSPRPREIAAVPAENTSLAEPVGSLTSDAPAVAAIRLMTKRRPPTNWPIGWPKANPAIRKLPRRRADGLPVLADHPEPLSTEDLADRCTAAPLAGRRSLGGGLRDRSKRRRSASSLRRPAVLHGPESAGFAEGAHETFEPEPTAQVDEAWEDESTGDEDAVAAEEHAALMGDTFNGHEHSWPGAAETIRSAAKFPPPFPAGIAPGQRRVGRRLGFRVGLAFERKQQPSSTQAVDGRRQRIRVARMDHLVPAGPC